MGESRKGQHKQKGTYLSVSSADDDVNCVCLMKFKLTRLVLPPAHRHMHTKTSSHLISRVRSPSLAVRYPSSSHTHLCCSGGLRMMDFSVE